MLNKLNWPAISNHERNFAIEGLKSIISKNDGYIINFNMFSDLALSISIEIEENKITKLYTELETEMTISEPPSENLDIYSKREWLILINLSFSKGTGNLKAKILDVPG